MTDSRDIIERLRDPAYPKKPAGDFVLRLSAADEIDRLRAENEKIEGDAAKLFREVMVAFLTRQAHDGTIPCAQISILADQHTAAFNRILHERRDGQ
jgi:hypothetical protein